MWDKIGKALAQILEASWQLIIWLSVFYFIYLVFVLGGLKGSFIERLWQLPEVISSRIFNKAPELFTTPVDSLLKFDTYVIVVNITTNRTELIQTISKLKSQRINAHYKSDNRYFIIYVGPVPTKKQADNILQLLLARGFHNAITVVPK